MDNGFTDRVRAWLGSPKETAEHPTLTLHTNTGARVIAIDDIRTLLVDHAQLEAKIIRQARNVKGVAQ